MVCVTDTENIVCQVQLESEKSQSGSYTTTNSTCLVVSLDNTVSELIDKIQKIFLLEENEFEVFVKPSSGDNLIPLADSKHKIIKELDNMSFDSETKNVFIVRETNSTCSNGTCSNNTEDTSYRDNDDLLLGASASPTTMEGPLMLTQGPHNQPEDAMLISLLMRQDIPYVGLVNQAMTCYLNSLLQALFMTPEFRNALYNWEFDGKDPAKSIPYQLQKLFLNLQTSSKSAVETTELTRSFGWDLSEAWQQHDIQELCRVMFDALEQKFKNTDQADLINRLYQGKMIDYVKCLECKTEKTREDTFLDIPLPVRPFGSCVAYGSVEEALRAFVQPETLDGNNQYFCETCNKKCDAHKGLKFTKIPYLLTLHLKRFDFDYSTMHRIKLNDKVTFPEKLDLNSFITTQVADQNIAEALSEEGVKCDDSSTTDSGSALDDEPHLSDNITSNILNQTNENSTPDDDEGIDCSGISENDKNRKINENKGPYIYELFSIMIHSGSASGGHYYAYIKDFRHGKWYCFDDQSVSRITQDDIRKTYGGGPNRSYYSGAYSSSTNAYMLMYRQIDIDRNVNAMTTEEFPKYIKVLLQNLREREESDRINKERELQLCKLKLYCNHPMQNQMMETKLFLHYESTMTEALEEAYRKTKLEGIVPIEQCRLVSYNRLHNSIECSFEGRDDETVADVIGSLKSNYKTDSYKTDWLLEIRNKNQEFMEYKPGGLNLKVYVVNIQSDDVEGPFTIRGYESQTWKEFKSVLAKTLNLNESTLHIAIDTYNNGSVQPKLIENENEDLICQASSCSAYKIYVSNLLDEDPDKPFIISKFHKIIDKFEHIISLEVVLPLNDKWTLEVLSIPPLDQNQNPENENYNSPKLPRYNVNSHDGATTSQAQATPSGVQTTPTGTQATPSSTQATPPQVPALLPENEDLTTAAHSDQSNSEDSSLSDSDRTLVGDVPEECLAPLSSASNSPAGSEQHLSSPEESQDAFLEENWDNEPEQPILRYPNYYFKVSEVRPEVNEHVGKTLKILVDKRTNLAKLKCEIEPYVGVPMEYFKIYRQYTSQELEWSRLADTLNLSKDGERLTVKLGRVLKENEHAGKVYLLTPNAAEPIRFLCDAVIAKGMTVGQAKKEILESVKKQHNLEIPFNRCRLRKKNWKSPNKVYLDDQKFVDDIMLHTNWEMFLQELSEPEIVQNSDQLLLFVRQWCPSTLELKDYQEILLDGSSVSEFKEKLSEFSGIPVENVDFTILKGTFPYEMSVLSIQSELEWNPNATTLNTWPLNVYDDGHAFLFRDNREEVKQLSAQEKKELTNKESNRLCRRVNKVSLYSPRKERALKIYLDISPRKSESDQNDID